MDVLRKISVGSKISFKSLTGDIFSGYNKNMLTAKHAKKAVAKKGELAMQMQINLDKKIGKIKHMNATGQAPMSGMGYAAYDNFHYLSDICVPYVRLHDVGGLFGGNRYVDIPNIFRDFDADENDPKNYDFTFTDAYIAALHKNGLKPYYRLGVTIENHAEVKSYHINPPKDFAKWARICERIIAHYNDGWADGFHYDIEYWEIWNEPDDGLRISQMWNGTPEEYYRLYDVTAKYVKERHPNIKIGGYAGMGFQAITDTPEKLGANPRHQYQLDFFHGFLKYIKEHGSPIDFFSWHFYNNTAFVPIHCKYVREQLDAYGFTHVESHLNEWNPATDRRHTGEHGAFVARVMLSAQNSPVDMLMIYDAKMDNSRYAAFSTPASKLVLSHAYYTFAAFSFLTKLGTQVELTCDNKDVYAVAASNGEKHAVMMVNLAEKPQELHISGVDLSNARWYIIDDEHRLSWSPARKTIEPKMIILIDF